MGNPETISLEGKKVLVTGGSKGLGLGIVEALVKQKSLVTVLARDLKVLKEIKSRLGVEIISADVTEAKTAERILCEAQPQILILNAGAVPPMGSIDKISWEDFTSVWNADVKATLHWIQAALNIPLLPGARVILGSSGAAVAGSPLSGGYAGAKKMIWWMAQYANEISDSKKLGIQFQATVPRQLFANTQVGEAGAKHYAQSRGITSAEIFSGFQNALSPSQYGEQIVSMLTHSDWQNATAIGFSGELGIHSLEGKT